MPALVPFAFVGGKLLLTTVSLKPAVLRLYTKHMQHLPACRGAGMCFGNKPWWGHEVHTYTRARLSRPWSASKKRWSYPPGINHAA